jgi:3-deoxy-7-phosphoheptulonate synthase
VRDPKLQAAYVKIVQNLSEALEFMKVVGADGPQIGIAGSAEVWMSHEALLLDYEEALTRKIGIPASATSSLNPQRKFVESGDGTGFYCTSA